MQVMIFLIVVTIIVLVWLGLDLEQPERQPNKPTIYFAKQERMFPEHWWQPPVSAVIVELDATELERSKAIVKNALEKYPQKMPLYLEYVYIFKSMRFYDVPYGGTYRAPAHNTVYLANDGYPNAQLERTFHAELSSVLLKVAPQHLDDAEWRGCLPENFAYLDLHASASLLQLAGTPEEDKMLLHQQGFLSHYATTNLENDFNSVVKELFVPSKGFWALVDVRPRIRRKVELTVQFYEAFDEQFSLEYFRAFDKGEASNIAGFEGFLETLVD